MDGLGWGRDMICLASKRLLKLDPLTGGEGCPDPFDTRIEWQPSVSCLDIRFGALGLAAPLRALLKGGTDTPAVCARECSSVKSKGGCR